MTGPFLLSSSGTQPVALQLAVGQFAGKAGAVFVGLLTAASFAAVARETCACRIPAALRIETATGTLAAYDRPAGRRVPGAADESARRTVSRQVAGRCYNGVPRCIPS
ncbi:MAG: hypothetical protein VB125_03090 [Burkholderia sp.]